MATSLVPTATPIAATSFVKMATHELPTVRGPQRHYTQHRFDWQTLFDELDGPSLAPALRAAARKYTVPPATLSFHYRKYKGSIDGRRDNHRIFSRAEAINKENVHPNKPVVQLLALRIHEEKQAQGGPTKATRSKAGPVQEFKASAAFVQRVKRVLNQTDAKPKIQKRRKQKKNPTAEEEDALAAVFREKVVQAVRSVGGGLTINADEVSGKFLVKPRTLWHEKGGPPPLLPSNHSGKEAFTMILATTAAGHKLKPAVVVVGKTERALKKFSHISRQSASDAGGQPMGQPEDRTRMWRR